MEYKSTKSKKHFILLCVFFLLLICCIVLPGCGLFSSNDGYVDNSGSNQPAVYKIQYTDDYGTYIIEVEDGDPFSLENIPQREGYEFLGLFDSEVGGTQYVSSNGTSLSAYTDKKNIVLFPQYKAKQYLLQLDFQGASVTGSRNYTVTYGESLPELPKNLILSNKEFVGWFTEPDCGGEQVADKYGLLLDKAIVNSANFDISDSNNFIYLYAGFEPEKFTVTFNFGNGIQSQQLQIDYNTPISQIVPNVRNSNGQAVLTWSIFQSGNQLFTGNITDNTVLYAVEWAPVVELDPNGGEEVIPVVAREGSSITLPTPIRENYKFMGWQNDSGDIVEIDTMPADGMSLTARWQAMLVFDENGGTEVNDISQPVGTAITLPTPEKGGYIFAGWYTLDKTEYTSTSMPAAGVALKAGWYKSKVATKTIISFDDSLRLNGYWTPSEKTYQVLLSSFIQGLDVSSPLDIHVKLSFSTKHEVSETDPEDYNPSIRCILSKTTSVGYNDSYLSTTFGSNLITIWQHRELEADISVNNGVFYVIFNVFNSDGRRVNANVYVSNFFIEVTYPDTSRLYL